MSMNPKYKDDIEAMIGERIDRCSRGGDGAVLGFAKRLLDDGETTELKIHIAPEPVEPLEYLPMADNPSHTFSTIESMIDWVKFWKFAHESKDPALIFVSIDGIKCVADEAVSRGNRTVVECFQQRSADFVRWKNHDGMSMKHADFLGFLKSIKRTLTVEDQNKIDLYQAVGINAKINSESIVNETRNGYSVSVDIRGNEKMLDIPRELTAKVPIYIGDDDVVLEVEILPVIPMKPEGEIRFTVCVRNLDDILIERMYESVDQITAYLDEIFQEDADNPIALVLMGDLDYDNPGHEVRYAK